MNTTFASSELLALHDQMHPVRDHVFTRSPAARIDGAALTFWQGLVGVSSFAIFVAAWAWALSHFGFLLGGVFGWVPAAALAAASFMVLGLAYAVVAQGLETLLGSKRREKAYFAPSWLQP